MIWLSVKRDFFHGVFPGSDDEKVLLMNTPVFRGIIPGGSYTELWTGSMLFKNR